MIPAIIAAIAVIPTILVSYSVVVVAVPLMMGAVEWGLIPIILVREAVRDGFPKGLGPLSEDYGEGIIVSPQGEDLGKYLAMLTQNFEELEWMQNKVFHVKIAEAREVFDFTEAIDATTDMENLALLDKLSAEEREKWASQEKHTKYKLSIALIPLNNYMKAFPKYRTSTLPTAAKAA